MTDRTPDTDDLLSAYHDGEATAAEAEAAARRLTESDDARSELEDYRAIAELLRGLPSEPAPDGLRAAVMRRIEREALLAPSAAPAAVPAAPAPAPRRRRRWLLGTGVGTVGLVSAGLLAAFFAEREADVSVGTGVSAPAPTSVAARESLGRSRAAGDRGFVSRDARGDRPAAAPRAMAEASEAPSAAAAGPFGRASAPDSLDSAANWAASGAMNDAENAADGVPALATADPLSNLSYRAADADPAVGDVYSYLERNGDSVVVVEATVVDVRRSLDALQVLFARNSVPAAEVGIGGFASAGGMGGRLAAADAPNRELGVYVEADESQVAAALGDFRRERETLALAPAGTLRENAEPTGEPAVEMRSLPAARGLRMNAPAMRGGSAAKEKADENDMAGAKAELNDTTKDAVADDPTAESPAPEAPALRQARVTPAPAARFSVPAEPNSLERAKSGDLEALQEKRLAEGTPAGPKSGGEGPTYQRVVDVPPVVLEQLRNQAPATDRLADDKAEAARKQDGPLASAALNNYHLGNANRRVRLLVVLGCQTPAPSPVEAPKPAVVAKPVEAPEPPGVEKAATER